MSGATEARYWAVSTPSSAGGSLRQMGPFSTCVTSHDSETCRAFLPRFEAKRACGRKNNSSFSHVHFPNLSHFVTELSPLHGQVVQFTGVACKVVKLPVARAERSGKPEQLEISLPHRAKPEQFPAHGDRPGWRTRRRRVEVREHHPDFAKESRFGVRISPPNGPISE